MRQETRSKEAYAAPSDLQQPDIDLMHPDQFQANTQH
ncbi:hypothetical protein C8R11_11444 [Nitrosomonas aestuarii]|nr:hypothetical protein C8R11_11444 [Nitrosomonas aestuarii]